MKLSFLRTALRQMDMNKRLQDVALVAQTAGKPRLWVMLDMLGCALRYGAGPVDYRVFALYEKSAAQRETFVTRSVNNELVRKWNDPAYCVLIDDKTLFHKLFGRFTKRDWLATEELSPEGLTRFCEGKERILYKPAREGCGRGIEAICPAQWTGDGLLAYLRDKPLGLLEEVVVQHPALAAVNPSSVNTVRVVTIREKGVCTPVFAFLRMGRNSKVVDNLNSDGIAARLDVATGKITLPAAGKDGLTFEQHPDTAAQLVGFTVPHWEKVLQIVKEASAVVPQVRYVGWDVAVRENDVLLIEGNSYPGHDILQLPAYTPGGFGLKPALQNFL